MDLPDFDLQRSISRDAEMSASDHGSPLDVFNRANPVGSPVIAWPLTHNDPPLITATRSAAWALGDGTPVVMVKRCSGGIALTHVVSLRQHDAEVAATALEDARAELRRMMDGFPQRGRHTRAGWALTWLDHIIDRIRREAGGAS